MDEVCSLSSPLATSTAWKKNKPENWNEEEELTFTAPDADSQLIDDGKEVLPYGESTMNLGKYLIPSHPAELEEDNLLHEPEYLERGRAEEKDELLLKLQLENDALENEFNFSGIEENLVDTSISHYFRNYPALETSNVAVDNSDNNSSIESNSAIKFACPVDSCDVFENPEKLCDDNDDISDSMNNDVDEAVEPEKNFDSITDSEDKGGDIEKNQTTEDDNALEDNRSTNSKNEDHAIISDSNDDASGDEHGYEDTDGTDCSTNDERGYAICDDFSNEVGDENDNATSDECEKNDRDDDSSEATGNEVINDNDDIVLENNDAFDFGNDEIVEAESDDCKTGPSDDISTIKDTTNTEDCDNDNDPIIDKIYFEYDNIVPNNVLNESDLQPAEYCMAVSSNLIEIGNASVSSEDQGHYLSAELNGFEGNNLDCSSNLANKEALTPSPVTPETKSEILHDRDDIVERILKEDKTPKFARGSYHYHSIMDKINEISVTVPKVCFPSTYTIDKPSLIGIPKKFSIAIQNKSSVWVQCVLKFDKTSQEAGFSCQNKFILQPNSTEELLFTFTPIKEGLAYATLDIEVESVISGLLPTQSGLCKITGFAEAPKLIINPYEIKFGTQVSCKESTFRIENISNRELPIKVLLITDGCEEAFDLSDPNSHYATSFIKLPLKSNEIFTGYIQFSPYDKYLDCYGHLQVYLDCPNAVLLKQIPISGTVGIYKVKIQHSKHNIRLETKPGVPCSTKVPFIYDGNLPSAIKLSAPTAFNINPVYIPSLMPGEPGEFEVIYFPTTIEKVEGKLLMVLGDGDTQYDSWKKRKRCRKREVNLTSPSRDIVPQRLRFTYNCIGSLNFKPPYLWTVFSTSAPLPEELVQSCGLKLGRNGGLNQKLLHRIPRTLSKEHTCQVSDHSSEPVLQEVAQKLKKQSRDKISLCGISSPNVPTTENSDVSPLMANKTFVNFGGARLGYQVETELLLKNDFPTKILCVELQIKSKSKCFYMLKGEEISLCCDLVLPAGSSRTIRLGYTAFTLSHHEGVLEISSKDKKRNHNIPLTGYGGTAEISLHGIQQSSSHLWIEMVGIQPNQRNTTCLTLNNTGNIPAFVKGLLESTEGYPLPSKLGWVNPSSLVIGPGTSRDIFVVFEPGDIRLQGRVASLKLYYGDEISRQRYCKVVDKYNISFEKIKELPFDPTVEFLIPSNIPNIVDIKIPELHRIEVDYPEERKLFENGIKQLFVSILSSKTDDVSNDNVLTETRKHTENNLANTSMAGWTLSTNEIYLRGKETSFTILNDSRRLLEIKNITFEKGLLEISPKNGTIEGNSGLEIFINVKDKKSFVTTLLVSSVNKGEKYLTIYHQPHLSSENLTQTIVFETIPVNQTVTSYYEFTNIYPSSLSWGIMSVGAPYRKADTSERSKPSRVNYSVFFFDTVKGSLPSGKTLSIPIAFSSQNTGHFNQVWEFSYTIRSNQTFSGRHKQRVILNGRSVSVSPSPIRSITSSSRLSNNSSTTTSKRKHDDVYLKTEKLFFRVSVFLRDKQSFKLSNPLKEQVTVTLHLPRPPFYCKYKSITIKPEHSVTVPMKFEPNTPGDFFDAIGIDTKYERLLLPLCGSTGDD